MVVCEQKQSLVYHSVINRCLVTFFNSDVFQKEELTTEIQNFVVETERTRL